MKKKVLICQQYAHVQYLRESTDLEPLWNISDSDDGISLSEVTSLQLTGLIDIIDRLLGLLLNLVRPATIFVFIISRLRNNNMRVTVLIHKIQLNLFNNKLLLIQVDTINNKCTYSAGSLTSPILLIKTSY